MSKLILIAICALTLASCISSKRMSYLQPTSLDSMKAERIDLAEYEKKYGKYDGVFLNSEYILEHSGGKSSWEYVTLRKLRFIVLKPDAEWLTTFRLDEDAGSKLKDVYIHIVSPDGRTQKFGMADLKVENSSKEGRVYKFAYPDVKKGTIIEEGYEIQKSLYPLNSAVNYDIPLQFSVPCERIKVVYAYPNWWRVQFKEIAPGEAVPHKVLRDDENRKTTLLYEDTNVPAIEEEPYSPFAKEITKYMEFMVTSLEMHIRYGTHDSWRSFANDFKSYFIDKESFWSGKVGSTVDDLIEHKENKVDRLDTIINYLQHNVKVGYGEANDNFADVLKRGEGNVYMVNGLARAMLAKADIPADFVLIHSAHDGNFDKDYVSYDQLYLPAVATTIDDKTYVVFPYIKDLPIDHIPDYMQGQKALKISEQGYNGFMDTPTGSLATNTVQEMYDLSIDEEGVITVQEEKTLLGANAFSARQALSELKSEEVEKVMKELLTYSEGDINLVSHEVVNQNDYKKPLIIRLKYTIDNLVTVTPEEVIFQTGGLFSPSSSQKWKVDTEERKNPIRIYFDERFTKNITLHYPMSWTLGTSFADVNYENQFGTVTASYHVAPGELTVHQERILRKAKESKEKIGDLLTVTGRRSKLYIPTLIFQVGN